MNATGKFSDLTFDHYFAPPNCISIHQISAQHTALPLLLASQPDRLPHLLKKKKPITIG